MFERLAGLEKEYEAVLVQLSDPDVMADHNRLRVVARRHRELEPVVMVFREYRRATEDIGAAKDLLAEGQGGQGGQGQSSHGQGGRGGQNEGGEGQRSKGEAGEGQGGQGGGRLELDVEDRDMMRAEVAQGEITLERLEDELKMLLLPTDPNAGKNVILEIRGAEGGEEANLFAKDLYEMYARYADRVGLKTEVLSADSSDMGGFNQVTVLVKGDAAWAHLKYEGGPHRVQRVPVTESQGRVHTSSATVTVLPEAEEVDVHIEDKDLKIDVYRSTGPGGQSVNTTDSAVRITHLPTGTVVAMQDEKSQIQNRAKAMQVLRARLLKAEQDRQAAELSETRRGQTGGGGRSEKIRTYNYKENRVTDHRVGLTLYKLDKVLMGELDEVLDALAGDERARQLADGGEDGPSAATGQSAATGPSAATGTGTGTGTSAGAHQGAAV